MAAAGSTETRPSQSIRPLIQSWTPNTTRVLLDGGTCAWDVLDHGVQDARFVNELNTELEDRGLIAQLQPARTNREATEGISLPSEQRRGDQSLFVERSLRQKPDFPERHPALHSLIMSVQETAQHHLQDSLDLDLSLTSVQIAEYPGDGVSGYLRHCDRGTSCQPGAQKHSKDPQRVLTVIYYPTPEDWSHDEDGGCLRLFLGNDHYDVTPFQNRMVVFRSDAVEHQVLPSLRRPRRAVTIWLYGKVKHSANGTLTLDPFHSRASSSATHIPLVATPGPPPLPIAPDDSSKVKPSIFVSVAAYRDSETGPTIRHLMETARYPERIFVGLVLQVAPAAYDRQEVMADLPTNEPWYDSQVRCLTLDARHATGPCSARALCQMLHRGEDYVLQIDSHMRFRANWDMYLIEQLLQCPGRKNVLTAYPIGYRLPNLVPIETRGTLLIPDTFGSDGMLRQRGRLFRDMPTEPVRCQLYAAGFNFGPASVIQDCPYDHSLHHLFFGEEFTMAVRLYTAGYDMFAPAETVCYHLWSRSHRPTDCFAFGDADKEAQQSRSIAVVTKQLTGEGKGLGSQRSAAEWADELGVDFAARTVRFSAPEIVRGAPDVSPDSLESRLSSLETSTKNAILSFLESRI